MRKSRYFEYIRREREIYFPDTRNNRIRFFLEENERWLILRYLWYLRMEEYFMDRGNKLLCLFFIRRKNKLGNRIGLKIMPMNVGPVDIHHRNVIINGHLGENCVFHGNNCIGNDGKTEDVPEIGNGVDFGYGAGVYGKVRIADGVTIGAGAVVVSDIPEENSVYAGIPARRIR